MSDKPNYIMVHELAAELICQVLDGVRICDATDEIRLTPMAQEAVRRLLVKRRIWGGAPKEERSVER